LLCFAVLCCAFLAIARNFSYIARQLHTLFARIDYCGSRRLAPQPHQRHPHPRSDQAAIRCGPPSDLNVAQQESLVEQVRAVIPIF
jgi:hypothetical protein